MKPEFQLIRSSRKTVSITVTQDGNVIVRAPQRMPRANIERFVNEKQRWIEKHLKLIAERRRQSGWQEAFSEEEIKQLTDKAKMILPPRVKYLAERMGLTYERVSVKHQRTLWGSCSDKKNLNLNCLLVLCPEWVMDYVIMHELCHLRHMNHSPAFWKTLSGVCPRCDAARQWLRTEGRGLIARLRTKIKHDGSVACVH